ncbi:MAG: glycosyltransferase family 1 protein, partial [Patescibacteria group bacterium]
YLTKMLNAVVPLASQDDVFLFANQFGRPLAVPASLQHPHVHVRMFHWPNKGLNAGFTFFHQPKLDHLLGGLDLIWMPNLNFVALSPDVKLVVTCHDLSFELYPEFFSLKHRLWHRLIQPHQLYRRANHVIANSQNTKQDLLRHYQIPPEKISVIYPGADVQTLPNPRERERVRTRYALPSSYLFHVGTMEPRKNVESIMRAFQILACKHPHLHLVLAGKMGWQSKTIRLVQRVLPDARRVHVLGYVPDQDLAPLTAGAQATVFPTYYEGFGFPPLESMAAGTPVVTSPHSSLLEVGGDAVLYADPYNVAEIAAVVDELLMHPELSEALRTRGRKQLTRFSWESTARKTLKCLEDVVQSAHYS